MTDEQLIGYCEIHCQTERALFNNEQVNRMLELAGSHVRLSTMSTWTTVRDEMVLLCEMARFRLKHRLPPIPISSVRMSHQWLDRY